MAKILQGLPAPKFAQPEKSDKEENDSAASTLGSFKAIGGVSESRKASAGPKTIPPYGERTGWVPKTLADYADGGAFPEIRLAQFPLNMGRGGAAENTKQVVALQTGVDGRLQYDAVLKQEAARTGKIVHTTPNAQKAQWSSQDALQKPNVEDEEEVIAKTREALNQVIAKKTGRGPSTAATALAPEYIKYTPNQQAHGHNANCAQRIIRMVDKKEDPLEPPKFKHKRLPRGPPSPPPPIHHSPPRKVTADDQANWRLPPAVSNWKNQKGFTLPLDKRLQAEGRGLQDVQINDKFASLTEALLIAERSAREEIRIRNDLLKQRKRMEEVAREHQLREIASRARAEQNAAKRIGENSAASASEAPKAPHDESPTFAQSSESIAERRVVPEFRSNDHSVRVAESRRKREIEREFKIEKSGKRSKKNRDADRDISERVALGQAQPSSRDALYDARLFNQSGGLDSGFDAGNDEKYGIYDKPLFADRSSLGTYKFEKDRLEENAG